MAGLQLTPHAVSTWMSDGSDNVSRPVVQVLSTKLLQGPGEAAPPPDRERYRIVVSDGTHFTSGMLASLQNHLIKNKQLDTGVIVRMVDYMVNNIRDRKITIILDLEVLSEPVAQIGNPISFENGQPFTDGPQQPAGQPQYQAPPQQQQQQQYNHQHPQHQPNFGNQQSYGQNYEVVNNNYMQHVGGHNEEDISQHPVCPIKSLSPYRQKWVIKARVTFKSTIRTWQNAKGAGKVANVNLLDEQGGEISATMWKDAVDKFYDFLQVDKVYYISRASIKQANKKFATLNSAYDLTLEINSIIQAAKDDSSIKKVIYNCVPLSDIATLPEQTLVDVCAIILNVGDLADIQTKRGVNTYKRNLTLGDKSNASIELTIWGDDAANFQEDGAVGSVLAGKSLRISDFNGKSLSTGMVTQLDRNPDIPEAHALRGWYDSLNPDQARFDPLSVRRMNDGGGQDYQLKSFAQMKDEYINAGDEPKYFSVKGTVTMYRKENNVFYPACQDCNRKLLMVGSSWSCEKCQINDAQPQYRYILSCTASDHTGSQWLSAFNDVGVQLIGYTADQLAEWKGSENDAAYDAAFDDANFKSYKFRIRAKQEVYQEERKVKCTIMKVAPIDFVADTQILLQEIGMYQ